MPRKATKEKAPRKPRPPKETKSLSEIGILGVGQGELHIPAPAPVEPAPVTETLPVPTPEQVVEERVAAWGDQEPKKDDTNYLMIGIIVVALIALVVYAGVVMKP